MRVHLYFYSNLTYKGHSREFGKFVDNKLPHILDLFNRVIYAGRLTAAPQTGRRRQSWKCVGYVYSFAPPFLQLRPRGNPPTVH